MILNKPVQRLVYLGLAFILFASTGLAANAEDTEEKPAPQAASNVVIEWGFNLVDVNSRRPAKFYQGQSVPDGFVLPRFRWSLASADAKNFLQFESAELFRPDERVAGRFGWKDLLRGRLHWVRVPWVQGNGARSLLSNPGTSLQQQSAVAQRYVQDPNFDGVLGAEVDNQLVPDLVRNLLSAATPFSLESKRRTGGLELTFSPLREWTIDLDFSDERRQGMRAMGSGTYDRLTFVPASGVGLDELFYVRGTELARPIDFTTRRARLETSYVRSWGFAQAGLEWSKFENGTTSLTYSNPLWYTDTYARSAATAPPGIFRGWSRGLWNQGRFALEPGNEGFHLNLSGGLTLPRSTRLTVTFVRGVVNQDEPFLPYSSNTALNGKEDLNQDGVVDARDVGTDVQTLPVKSLNGKAVSTSLLLTFSARPFKSLQFNVRVPYFRYKNNHGRLSFPYRVEYVESNWNPGIQNVRPVYTELTDHTVKGVFVEGIVKPSRLIAVRLFGERRTREYEEREVKSTSSTSLGVGLTLTPLSWLDARLSYARSGREFDGEYTPKYTGEQQSLRMFDLAKVDRDALQLEVGADAGERLHLGANVRSYADTYPESTFGLQKTKTTGYGADASYSWGDGASIFLYADLERYDFQGHGDTKMGVFDRPGNDWYYKIADKTLSLGAGLSVALARGLYTLDLTGYWVDGNVASSNRNANGTPYSPLAAGAVNFPDQGSQLGGLKLQVVRKINERFSIGLAYSLERYRLSDFAWDNMNAYGFDFLTVDNALRYMFLDSRYGSYTVNIGQVFFRFSL